jgi:hypothetical protein
MNIRAKIFGGGEADPSPVVGKKRPGGAKTDKLNSVKVARDEYRRGNTRGADRHRLSEEQVRVVHDGTSHLVDLINLSGGGAMIAGDLDPRLWDRLDLHLGEGGVIECAVRWLKGNRIGLEFAHETRLDCSVAEQAELLRATIARSFPEVEFEVAIEADDAAPEANEHRRERRHPLIWSGALHHDYETTPIRLRNISSTGALIECGAPLRVGSEPLLDLGEAGTVFATVAWIVGDQVGLKFHDLFDLSRLAQSTPEVAPQRWDRPEYLRTASDPDSPWADEWGRLSLGELRDELEGFMKR